MRTTFTALALIAAISGSASAADVYSSGGLKDPVMASTPAPSWTGLILGVGAVGAYVNHDIAFQDDHVTQAELNGAAGFGPGADFLVGFRYQFPQSRLVFGIEAEYDITNAPSTLSFPTSGWSANMDLQGQWAILGTAGLVINPNTMAYVGGGFGEGFFHVSVPGTHIGLATNPTVQEAVFKAGLEAKLPWVAQGAFIRGEYEFRAGETVTLWSESCAHCGINEGPHTVAIKDTPDTNVAKLVLGYQFGLNSTPLESFK